MNKMTVCTWVVLAAVCFVLWDISGEMVKLGERVAALEAERKQTVEILVQREWGKGYKVLEVRDEPEG